MACFVVPSVEAIAVTAAVRVLKAREKISADESALPSTDTKIPLSRKLQWLANLLWGGSFLLAFEHLWHGEIVPWFPFLTAVGSPDKISEVLHEMSTAGIAMALLVTAVWAGMVCASGAIAKRAVNAEKPVC